MKIYLSTLPLLLPMVNSEAKTEKERPNILWLTFEDSSYYEFGCYGNGQVHTPNIDRLAANGVQFMNAWSVAPQSSAARSSLITGCYATTYGMDVHPVPYATPEHIFFPEWLREAGYYCTNNSKTHYNTTVDHQSCWDECSNKASYHSLKRKEGQPFFAVYNTVTSHMGRVRTFHTDGRRDYTKEGIYPDQLILPSHVPDLPEVRSDYAGHLEAVQDVDRWVGFFLDDLKKAGLAENTIIFVFSDHGGCLPRGKGYLYETGLRVPLVAYFPEKWKHLAPVHPGTKDESLISFVDLGPSMLSLAGIKPPKQMQGQALMGAYKVKSAPQYMYALAANQLHHYMPVRAMTDGRYKYIRSYIPYRQFALRNYYQWGMPSNKAWDQWVMGGHNTRSEWQQPFEHHTAELLFDLQADPFELSNLAGDGAYQQTLLQLRQAMSKHIRETGDLGFFLPTSREKVTLYTEVRRTNYPLDELYRLVELAGMPTPDDLPILLKALASTHPEMRYWGAVGCAQLGVKGKLKSCPEVLLTLLSDPDPYVGAEAAYAVAYAGYPDKAIGHLLHPQSEAVRKIGYSALECLSLDRKMLPYFAPYIDQLLRDEAALPHKANEDAGLMARGLLVNLGRLPIKDLHGKEAYEEGLKLNHGRRPMVPLPQ